MEEIAQKYLDCKTEKDYLDFIIYLYDVIDTNKDWEKELDGNEKMLHKCNFCNKLISLSYVSLENLARKK